MRLICADQDAKSAKAPQTDFAKKTNNDASVTQILRMFLERRSGNQVKKPIACTSTTTSTPTMRLTGDLKSISGPVPQYSPGWQEEPRAPRTGESGRCNPWRGGHNHWPCP